MLIYRYFILSYVSSFCNFYQFIFKRHTISISVVLQKILLNFKILRGQKISTLKTLTKNWTFFARLEKLLKEPVISVNLRIFNVLFFYFSTMMTTTREIEISAELQIEKPPLSTNSRFYRIYSPNKFVLRPNEIKTIN